MNFLITAIFTIWVVFLTGAVIALGNKPHGGEIICTKDGIMSIQIGRIEGIDPNAIRQGLFYLCDPDTMGFGYANPRWILIKGARTNERI